MQDVIDTALIAAARKKYIPLRMEGPLAVAWRQSAASEGHERKLPPDGQAQRIAQKRGYGMARILTKQALCSRNYLPTIDVARRAGVPEAAALSALRGMQSNGEVEKRNAPRPVGAGVRAEWRLK